jgi:prephenate dehydrogenase
MNKTNIVIIGLGHIGGSLASSLKKVHGNKVSIVGIDQSKAVINLAKQSNLFSEVSTLQKSLKLKSAHVIFVATGICDMDKLFTDIGKISFNNKVVVSDVGSIKVDIFKQALKNLPKNFDFVGGHPIAGTEKAGFKNLVTGLFSKKPVFISGIRAKRGSTLLIKTIWESLGSHVYSVTPEKHDKIFAYLSHLPHVLAFGLKNISNKNLTKKEILKYGGTSYKDYSRISDSSEELWTEIFLSNRKNLISGIKDFRKYLNKLEILLKSDSADKLKKLLKS